MADMIWEDHLFEILPDPDMVGSSEYRVLYELAQTTVESANIGGDDPYEMLRGALIELEERIGLLRRSMLQAKGASSG